MKKKLMNGISGKKKHLFIQKPQLNIFFYLDINFCDVLQSIRFDVNLSLDFL